MVPQLVALDGSRREGRSVIATCIQHPEGRGGLQGFVVGERYRVEEVPPTKKTPWARLYYRVWPVEGSHYSTCNVVLFNELFRIEK